MRIPTRSTWTPSKVIACHFRHSDRPRSRLREGIKPIDNSIGLFRVFAEEVRYLISRDRSLCRQLDDVLLAYPSE
ncbi:hypothetical protein [Halocatena marina]|uniref:hypothetical protein n=1 Tax=Halocatena marina TaxID=2934937 RepID=UPI00200DDD0D|nr:hypothetical protein [Halocatena marina]